MEVKIDGKLRVRQRLRSLYPGHWLIVLHRREKNSSNVRELLKPATTFEVEGQNNSWPSLGVCACQRVDVPPIRSLSTPRRCQRRWANEHAKLCLRHVESKETATTAS